MERTRLRELTQYFIVRPPFVFFVEMERTRLRELTHLKTSFFEKAGGSRNGAYPIKGIDTTPIVEESFVFVNVEMERTRLRELTLC